MTIPPIPVMSATDEEWIAWAAGTYAMRPETLRGMLAAFYTMRAKSLAKGIESISSSIRLGEQSLVALAKNTRDPEWMVEQDQAMWNELLPQLRELAR